jgi:ubiquinone/menaquinone biosynthesis C-methylase UbiE
MGVAVTDQPEKTVIEPRDTHTPLDPKIAWDNAADTWDDFVENGADYYRTEVHGPALLEACGPVSGKKVLDIGSGQGWFSRQLAQSGAHVTGVDLAPGMIAHARRHEADNPLGIDFVELDAAQLGEHFPANSFDLVTACMVLHDLPNADAVLKAVHRVLVPEGRFVFSILHPVTHTRVRNWVRDVDGRKLVLGIDRYFESGPQLERWDMARLTSHWETTRWHRTLSDWSSIIDSAGLRIRRLHEPRPTPDQVERIPRLEGATRVPAFLIIDLESLRI